MSTPADGSPPLHDPQPLTPLPADSPWWAKWLVANWRTIWKEVSTWCLSAVTTLAMLPILFPSLETYLSGTKFKWIIGVIGAAGIAAKFIKQKGLP